MIAFRIWLAREKMYMKRLLLLQLFTYLIQVLYASEPSGRGYDWSDESFFYWRRRWLYGARVLTSYRKCFCLVFVSFANPLFVI